VAFSLQEKVLLFIFEQKKFECMSKTKLINSVEKFISLEVLPNDTITTFHSVVAIMHHMCANIGRIQDQVCRDEILQIIEPARILQGKSPLIKRFQEWPRGYPGDFETINYMLNSKNLAKRNSVQFFCETYALSCAVAQQHRNKIFEQVSHIISCCHKDNKEKHILSLACGSNVDIQSVQKLVVNKPVNFVLFDMDKDALSYSREKLHLISDKCTFINGNILRAKRLIPQKEFDLIIIGGLFDYLPDKAIITLLTHLYSKKLKKNGQVFFTNITKPNPFRIWLQYFVNWNLIERNKEMILTLIEKSGIPANQANIYKDGTNLTNLVEITKK
jgi:extracellular factor (EF) 3-hydroxypalmitic acid methyl ester biosynthesis protein